jgi:hypothetical protein
MNELGQDGAAFGMIDNPMAAGPVLAMEEALGALEGVDPGNYAPPLNPPRFGEGEGEGEGYGEGEDDTNLNYAEVNEPADQAGNGSAPAKDAEGYVVDDTALPSEVYASYAPSTEAEVGNYDDVVSDAPTAMQDVQTQEEAVHVPPPPVMSALGLDDADGYRIDESSPCGVGGAASAADGRDEEGDGCGNGDITILPCITSRTGITSAISSGSSSSNGNNGIDGGGGGMVEMTADAPQRRAYSNESAIIKHDARERAHWPITALKCGNFTVCARVEKEGGEFSLCSACQIVPYCSSDCQTKHWAAHEAVCNELKAEALASHSCENIELMRQIRSKYSATAGTANNNMMAVGDGSGGASGKASKYVNDLFELGGFAVPFSDRPIEEDLVGTFAAKEKQRSTRLRSAGVSSDQPETPARRLSKLEALNSLVTHASLLTDDCSEL